MTDARKEHERRLGIRASVAWPGDAANPASVSGTVPAASQGMGRACEIGIADGSQYVALTPLATGLPDARSEVTVNTFRKSTLAVTLLRKGGVLSGFEVSGHARFGTPGQDIVCAGVSAIAQACQRALESVVRGLAFEQTSGFLKVSVSDIDLCTQAVMGMLRVAEVGFQGIAESYPGWLSVRYEEVS